MTFCPQCGRPRAGEGRFCGTCGHEFTQRAADTGPASGGEPAAPAAPVQPEQFYWDGPATPTRADAAFNVEHPETVIAGRESPPAAAGPVPPPGEQANEPASPWSAGWDNTVTAGPGHANAYTPPPYSPPPYTPSPYAPPAAPGPAYVPPPSPGDQGQPPGRRMTAIFVVVAVLVVLAAGGGAYALTRSQHPTAQPPSQPTGAATTSSPTAAQTTASESASPTASPSPSATPRPTHTGTVQVASGVSGDPAEPKVLAYLNRYFGAINAHNYNAYNSLLDAQGQAGDSLATFNSGYGTTKDSNEVLTSIQDTGGGDVTANVSFTSRQSLASSASNSTCTNWQISLFLVPSGSSYVKTSVAPPGYHAAYSSC